jgi:hypothetical protein
VRHGAGFVIEIFASVVLVWHLTAVEKDANALRYG